MSKCRIMVLIIAVLLLSSACEYLPESTGPSYCADQYGYRYYEQDGGHYIHLNTRELGIGDGSGASLGYVEFQSFGEMVSDIAAGNFTWGDCFQLAVNSVVYTNRGVMNGEDLPVCDLNALYQLRCPAGLAEPTIMWTGPEYWQTIQSDAGNISAYHSSSYQLLQLTIDSVLADSLLKDHSDDIIDIKEEADRSATAYYWETWQGKRKSVFYELHNNGITYKVREDHYFHDYDYIEGVPTLVSVCFEAGEHTAFIEIDTPAERPSVEWLTSFDFYEYVAE